MINQVLKHNGTQVGIRFNGAYLLLSDSKPTNK
jgi:hypothetical protein